MHARDTLINVTGVHSDKARGTVRKLLQKHHPFYRLIDDLPGFSVNVVKLNDVFRDVHTYRRQWHFGASGLLGKPL